MHSIHLKNVETEKNFTLHFQNMESTARNCNNKTRSREVPKFRDSPPFVECKAKRITLFFAYSAISNSKSLDKICKMTFWPSKLGKHRTVQHVKMKSDICESKVTNLEKYQNDMINLRHCMRRVGKDSGKRGHRIAVSQPARA